MSAARFIARASALLVLSALLVPVGPLVSFGLLVPVALSAQLPAYNIPDDPAFAFLGVAPKKVANPGTLPKLGLAIANGIDVDGRVNTGLAVSFLPSTMIRFSPAPERYRNGSPAFWLYNTQVSLATIRASGDTGSADLGYGFRTILRGPEPYTDPVYRDDIASLLDRCLTEAGQVDTSTVVIRKMRNGGTVSQDTVRMWKPGPSSLNGDVAVDCANRRKAPLLKRWMDRHWNDATLAVSFAAGTRFVQSSARQPRALGTGLWMLGGLPIRRTSGSGAAARVSNIGQLAAQLHYAAAPRTAPADERRTWDWGLRAMAGSARSNAFAELTRGLKKHSSRQARAWSTGVEYMAAESIWLSVGIGDRFSDVTSSDKTVVFANLKWGLAREPELGAR